MIDPRELVVRKETKIVEYPAGEGLLRVYETHDHGQLVDRRFTFDSLASVLGKPLSTLEGRYARTRLRQWNTPVYTKAGRPLRAFPYDKLTDVVALLTNRGARVESFLDGDSTENVERVSNAPLVPTIIYEPGPNGAPTANQYYSVAALAEFFQLSATSIRNKMRKTGLYNKFKNLKPSSRGGRPTLGIHERYMAQVKLAVVDGIEFTSAADRDIAAALIPKAKAQMALAIDNVRPLFGQLAVDTASLSVNGVNTWDSISEKLTGTPTTRAAVAEAIEGLDDFVTGLEQMLGGMPADSAPSHIADESTANDTDPMAGDWPEVVGEYAVQARKAALDMLTCGKAYPSDEDIGIAMGIMQGGGATRAMGEDLLDEVNTIWDTKESNNV